jgi:tetratricopeptide (TPR) repeat protein
MDHWLAKINKIEAWQAACIIAIIGLSVFSTGLNNPFQGDDQYQIVNNVPVHSIKNIPQLFNASTFYNGQKLTGVYYRPLMSTVFSIIYTVFGAHPLAFHIVQLALYLSSAFVLYLVFKHFLKPVMALPLALIYLVHPLNSQVVYSIPTMQDALFFFFGILAIWLLISRKSVRSLWAVAACLFLAMLSKEAGLVFTIMALLYLFWFDRERLRTFAGIMILPIVLYLTLKLHAVGINHEQHAAPIDSVNLIGRLLTVPSILLFYATKFIFPWKLATGYYWVYPTFSVRHVVFPLVVDLVLIGLFVYLGIRIRQKLSKAKFYSYLFFAAWTVTGLVIYLPILKLDMTAGETWFYFTMAGLLGMLGVALMTVKARIQPEWLLLPVVLLIGVLGVRSALRGTDYRSQYNLAVHDLAASGGNNYSAMSNISQYLIDHGKYKEAAAYAQRSIDIYPVVSNYINLGVALEQSGDYPGAVKAYNQALKYGDVSIIYENLGLILLVYSDPATTNQFFQRAINAYPHDFRLWVYLAIFEGAKGSNKEAKVAIANAAKYGPVPPVIYNNIMNNQPFALPLLGKTLLVR